MAGWTCGCGRQNFSSEYPCMICGAPSPAQATAQQAAETLAELRALAPPSAPKRRLKRHHGVPAAALGAAVVVIAWFGLHGERHRPSQLAASAAVTTDNARVTPVTAFPSTTTTSRPLLPLDQVLVAPPHDFAEVGIAGERNGPLGLADFDDPSDHRMMQNAHFTGGFEHTWKRQGAPDVIIKAVLEFADEPHATDAYNTMAVGENLLPGGEVPGAVIGTSQCGFCDVIGQAVMFRKGGRVFMISVVTTEGRFTEAEASALAVEQYQTL